MKQFRSLALPVLLAGVLAGGLAFAGTLSKSFTIAATSGEPTSTANCLDLTNHVTHQPVTEVDVTAGDYNDGGADDEYFIAGRVLAYRYDPDCNRPDGGFCMNRLVAYDLAFRDITLDGNPNVRSQTATITLPTKGIDNAKETAKLCFASQGWATDGGSVVDAGAPLPLGRLIIRGRYAGN